VAFGRAGKPPGNPFLWPISCCADWTFCRPLESVNMVSPDLHPDRCHTDVLTDIVGTPDRLNVD
jgi:hypothetical protein